MMKKAAVLFAILLVSGAVSLAWAGPHRHHQNTSTSVVQQTTLVGSFVGTNTASVQDTGGSTPPEEATPPADSQTDSTLVSADINNKINRAGDITSIVSAGEDNQANAASIAITSNSQVSGKVINRINTSGNITATVEDGNNNLANAGTVSIKGAVSSGRVMNRVRETGDVTSIVSGGDNNQANAASVAIN